MEGFKHILVDGWNAIHAHARLARELVDGRAEEAQSELSQMLAPIHDFEGARVTIVYDGNGSEISIVRKGKILSFSELYTPSFMTADEVIEQLCATSKRPQELLVVTRDNLLRLTASTFGAMTITPENFFERGEASRKAMCQTASANNEKGSREWKKSNPFSKLDELAADIAAISNNGALVSKKMKRKLKKSVSKCEDTIAISSKEKKSDEVALKKKDLPETKASASSAVQGRRPIIGGKPATVKSLAELKNVFSTMSQSSLGAKGEEDFRKDAKCAEQFFKSPKNAPKSGEAAKYSEQFQTVEKNSGQLATPRKSKRNRK